MHIGYLRYVVRHKWLVFKAGLVIGGYSLPWLWRLLVHDLSKFSLAEWSAYACFFYGPPVEEQARREVNRHIAQYHPSGEHGETSDTAEHAIGIRTGQIALERKRAFNAAWLHHIHANPHHWQHWILHQDDGRTIVLVPDNATVNEMIADWIGAGPKVLVHPLPTMAQCVAETIVWYTKQASGTMQLRAEVREHVEATLHGLARHYGLHDFADAVREARHGRASLTIGAR